MLVVKPCCRERSLRTFSTEHYPTRLDDGSAYFYRHKTQSPLLLICLDAAGPYAFSHIKGGHFHTLVPLERCMMLRVELIHWLIKSGTSEGASSAKSSQSKLADSNHTLEDEDFR